MEIDTSGLPLDLDLETDPDALQRRAGARLAATEAWLDGDAEGIGRIAAEHRTLAPDLDPLQMDLLHRREPPERERQELGSMLERLATDAGDSDDPDLRTRNGTLARKMVEDHAAAGLLEPDETEALIGGYDALLSEADAGRLTRTAPTLARELIADDTVFPGLTPDRRAHHGRQAEARLSAAAEDQGFTEERAVLARPAAALTEAARHRALLGRRVSAGEASLADIAAAEAAGEIDGRGAGILRARFDARRQAMVQAAAGIERVETVLRGGGRLDPASAEDRAAIDAHYRGTRQGWEEAGLSPDEVRGELVAYLIDSNVVPRDVGRRIGRIFRAGTPGESAEAADLIVRIGEVRPDLLAQIDATDVQSGLGIAALERAGWPREQAAGRYAALQMPEMDDPVAARDRRAIEEMQQRVVAASGAAPPAPLVKPAFSPPLEPAPKPAPSGLPSDVPPIPDHKADSLKDQQDKWKEFHAAAKALPDATPTETHILMTLFAQEGGMPKDHGGGSAASGIVASTLDGLIGKGLLPDIPAGTAPSDLTVQQRVAVYRAYFDDVLGLVGGAKALSELPDKETAAAFADVMFRDGWKGGAKLIQQAVNRMQAGRVTVDESMGQQTYDAFKEMAEDPARRDKLLNTLADERLRGPYWREGWRINFYRPQKPSGR